MKIANGVDQCFICTGDLCSLSEIYIATGVFIKNAVKLGFLFKNYQSDYLS
jgi:hypothetical protein